jgi:hypothetical protein
MSVKRATSHVVVFISCLVPSCALLGQAPRIDSLPAGISVPIRPLSDDTVMLLQLADARDQNRLRRVLRDRSTLESWWAVSVRRGRPPSVDFASDMALVAGNGLMRDGSNIAIVRAVARGDSLYVLVRTLIGIMPGCLDDGGTSPVAVGLVPKRDGPVVFVDMTRDEGCAKGLPNR